MYDGELTLQDNSGTELRESRTHEVSEHFDVVVVPQTVLHVAQELAHVQPVQARAQQRVHAFEGGLAQIQSVVYGVLERTHFYLAD